MNKFVDPSDAALQAATLFAIVTGQEDPIMDFRAIPERDDAKTRVAAWRKKPIEERKPLRFNFRGRLSQLLPTLKIKNEAGWGIYFVANQTDGEGRKRANMTAARIVALDLDGSPLPKKWKLPPHIVIETSPERYQCFWAIEETADFVKHREIMKRIALQYGGDISVSDITRVFRVPGFLHQKADPFQSCIVKHRDAEFDRHELSHFEFLNPLPPRKERPELKREFGSVSCAVAKEYFDHLPASEFSKGRYNDWVRVGMAMHFATAGEAAEEWVEWCASDPIFCNSLDQDTASSTWDGFELDKEDPVTVGTLIHYGELHGVPEDVLDKLKFPPTSAAKEFADQDFLSDDDEQFAENVEERGAEAATGSANESSDYDDILFEGAIKGPPPPPKLSDVSAKNVNDVFFLVNIGGKPKVMRWGKSPIDEKVRVPELMETSAFKVLLQNKFVTKHRKKVNPDGEESIQPVRTALSKVWLEDRTRYTYDGLIFRSDVKKNTDSINLWRGYGVEENDTASWSLLQKHVKEIIANGERGSWEYILNWCAWALQNPTTHGEVALVLYSAKHGTGKGTLGHALRLQFGAHGLHITQPTHIVGKFNAHLAQTSLLFSDEALFPGYKEHKAVLKTMITEPTIMIEPKGINAFAMPNAIKLIMASNEKWVVAAGTDERRYAVFEVNDDRAQNHNYFDAIRRQLYTQGGLGRMLYDLRRHDVRGWHPRNDIPQTAALADQKRASALPIMKWFADLLNEGVLPRAKGKQQRLSANQVTGSVLYEHARLVPGLKHESDQTLADFIKRRGATRARSNGSKWTFPPLPDLRKGWLRDYSFWEGFDSTVLSWSDPDDDDGDAFSDEAEMGDQ